MAAPFAVFKGEDPDSELTEFMELLKLKLDVGGEV
jgi:hypothetical protein